MTASEYLALPMKRTAPLPMDEEEKRAMEAADSNPEVQNLPENAAALIVHYCYVNNYRFCEQTLKRALVELRPFFNEQPTAPVEAPALYDASKSEYLKQRGLVPASVRQAESQQAEQASSSLMKDAAKKLDEKQREAKFYFALNDVEKLDGSSIVGQTNKDRESGIVPGRSQGMVSHGDKFRQRIEAYTKLKETFTEPAEIAEIDRRIRKEREHFRW